MRKITSSLNSRMKGVKVEDLQAALQLLLNKGALLPDNAGARRELSGALKLERAKRTYGNATRKLVSIFQEERRLEVSGSLDKPTANLVLNSLLDEVSDTGEGAA